MTTFLNDDLAPADSDERAEAMAHDALVYELSVVLMRLDGNEGDPHQLIWCGGPTPEPWGDAWQKYEEQAQAVLNAIGDGSATALVEAMKEDAWVARVVSSGPANFPLLQWRSAEVSLRTAIGTKLYLHPHGVTTGFRSVGKVDCHISADLDLVIGTELFIRARGVKACRYTNEPGGACWREGKAVEICTCHNMTDNDFAESVKRHAECRAPLGNAGVKGTLNDQPKEPK